MPSLLDRLSTALVRRAAPVPPQSALLPPAYKSTWLLTPQQPWYMQQGTGSYPDWTFRTTIDYSAAAGDLALNSTIMACIGWLLRAEPEAPWRVLHTPATGAATPVPVPRHPLLPLLRRPNPYYSGLNLRAATCFSYNLAGNAYWLKERNALGQVIRLWYEPHFTIRAVWPQDGSAFLTGYEIYRDGRWLPRPAADVVHFRDGVDPQNPRYGLSRLAAALRDVATDNEAARYAYTVLRNTGIVPVVLSPRDKDVSWDKDEREYITSTFQQFATGDNRGKALALSAAALVQPVGTPPAEMAADALRAGPQANVAALLSTPAVIVGLLVGLEHSTYNNMDAARQHAWEGNLIPYYRVIDDTVGAQLLADLPGTDPEWDVVEHDLRAVRALLDVEIKRRNQVVVELRGGDITRNEARADLGKDAVVDGDVFLEAKPTGTDLTKPSAPNVNTTVDATPTVATTGADSGAAPETADDTAEGE